MTDERVEVDGDVGPAVDDEAVDRDSAVVVVGHNATCPVVKDESTFRPRVVRDDYLHVEGKPLWQVKLQHEVWHD